MVFTESRGMRPEPEPGSGQEQRALGVKRPDRHGVRRSARRTERDHQAACARATLPSFETTPLRHPRRSRCQASGGDVWPGKGDRWISPRMSATRSPTATFATSGPMAATRPAASKPKPLGSGIGAAPLRWVTSS
jgi:hypothetical protein